MRQMYIDCGSGSGGGKFPAIPVVCGEPSGPPAEGTPPIRVDCENYLWVWDENGGQWIRVGGSDAPDKDTPTYSSIAGQIDAPCTDTLMRGYYLDKTDPTAGYKYTKFNMTELAGVLDKCGLVGDGELADYLSSIFSPQRYDLRYWTYPVNRGMAFSNVQLDENYFASFAVHSQQWEEGSGDIVQAYEPQWEGGNPTVPVPRGGKITVTNPFDSDALAVCYPSVSLSVSGVSGITRQLHMLVTDDPTLDDRVVRQGRSLINGQYIYSNGWPTQYDAFCSSKPFEISPLNYYYTGPVGAPTSKSLASSCQGRAGMPHVYHIPANSSIDLYLRGWCSMYSPSHFYDPNVPNPSRTRTISAIGFGFIFMMDVSIFPAR